MTITVHSDPETVRATCTALRLPSDATAVVEWTDDDDADAALRLALRHGTTVERRGSVAVAYRKMKGIWR